MATISITSHYAQIIIAKIAKHWLSVSSVVLVTPFTFSFSFVKMLIYFFSFTKDLD